MSFDIADHNGFAAGPQRSVISVARPGAFTETAAALAGGSTRMMAAFLLKGIVVGIVIAVPVGPVGVLCIRRTILDGRIAGLSSGTGAATADAMFAVIAGFGLTALSDWLFGFQDWLRIGGAVFLFYIGISAFLHDPAKPRAPQLAHETVFTNYASTFALTITNPVTILSFLAIFAPRLQ